MFAPLRRLQRDLAVPGQVNTILVAGGERTDAEAPIGAARSRISACAVRRRRSAAPSFVESAQRHRQRGSRNALPRSAVRQAGLQPVPVFTYLANTIRKGDRDVPYSLVTATDLEPDASRCRFGAGARADCSVERRRDRPQRVGGARARARRRRSDRRRLLPLGSRTAGLVTRTRDVHARRASSRSPGWPPTGGSRPTIRASPVRRAWRTGIRHSRSISLASAPSTSATGTSIARRRRRSSPTSAAATLWRSRYGALTSIRLPVPDGADAAALAARLRDELRTVALAERDGRRALSGASGRARGGAGRHRLRPVLHLLQFLPVVSALLLAVLFFKLGVEQRLRQIGILRAAGYSMAIVRRLLLGEAIILAVAGGALGIAGAVLLRAAHRLRSRDLVGRRGRDDDAGAAREAGVARAGRDWRRRGRDAVRPRLAARGRRVCRRGRC